MRYPTGHIENYGSIINVVVLMKIKATTFIIEPKNLKPVNADIIGTHGLFVLLSWHITSRCADVLEAFYLSPLG